MDSTTQRLIEERLRECREEAVHRLTEDEASPDPLERLWRRALQLQVREIEAALERLAEPGYGVCEQCRESIPTERLYAKPWARRCFPCETAAGRERETLLRSGFVPSFWY